MTRRRGFTLPELLVMMLITGIVGLAITKLFLSQSRFYDQESQMRRARFVARTAVNAALSDLRMVEATGGVVAASPTQVTVRAPYAAGIVCGSDAVQTTVSLWPADSTEYATAGFSGYAWRDSLGTYTYVEGGAAVGPGSAAVCAAANVAVLPNGRVVAVAPPLPAGIPAVTLVGTPVFLIRRVTYAFKRSVAIAGRTALWRTIVATGRADELVAPFDSTARFRFFAAGADTAENAPPMPLSRLRGLELNLDGQSERAPQGAAAPIRAQLVTAVFFNNQLK